MKSEAGLAAELIGQSADSLVALNREQLDVDRLAAELARMGATVARWKATGRADDAESFVRAIVDQAGLVDVYSMNWNAFEEALRHEAQRRPRTLIVIVEKSEVMVNRDRRQWETVLEIFRDASHVWKAAGSILRIVSLS